MLQNNILTHFFVYYLLGDKRHLHQLDNARDEHTKKADARHETMSLHPPIIIMAYLCFLPLEKSCF